MLESHRRVTLEIIDEVVNELRWQWFEEREEHGEGATGKNALVASKARMPRVMLMVHKSGQFLEQVQIAQFPFVIGRSNANDLVVIDKEVSRRHALIDCIGGIYVVEDLNSKNGILVNRKRRPRALLRSGDVISFGQVDVVFYSDRAAAREAASQSSALTSDKAGIPAQPADEPAAEIEQTARRKNRGALKLS